MTGEIVGGFAKWPRWYVDLIRHLDENALRVLVVLVSLNGAPGTDGTVSPGAQRLAQLAGCSKTAALHGIADLSNRGVIVRVYPSGPSGRHRWRLVTEQMPPGALARLPTMRAKHARDAATGRFK